MTLGLRASDVSHALAKSVSMSTSTEMKQDKTV